MKKKFLSFILAMCFVLPCMFALTACQYFCEMETEWTYDNTHHWHACKFNDCTEVSDRAEHEWDNGVNTGDGCEKTYTCKQCAATKVEEVILTVNSEWDNALSMSGVDNMEYMCTYYGHVEIYKVYGDIIYLWFTDASTAPDTASEFYFANEDGVYYEYSNTGYGWYKKEILGSEYKGMLPKNYLGSLYADFMFVDFTFNPETERYENWIDEPEYEQYTAIAFEDGKVSEVCYMDGIYQEYYEKYTYGNVKLFLPEDYYDHGQEE